MMSLLRDKRFSGKHFAGQSLTEYGIIVALIGVVSLGTWLGLSDVLKGQMSELAANGSTGDIALTAVIPPGQTGIPDAGASSGGSLGDTGTLTSGYELNSAYAGANSENAMVETAGANGTTTFLSGQISQVAKQLLAEGKIDESQAGTLTALANKGHEIAYAEYLLEQAAKTVKGWEEFSDYDITLNGKKTYTWGIAAMIGVDAEGRQGSLSKEFDALMAQAKSSGALSDPAAKAYVSSLVNDINDIAMEMLHTTGSTMNGDRTPEDLLEIASKTTNVKSKYICETGQGSDSGTYCAD